MIRVAFRADASLQIGTGHVMRCLTLAEALKDNGSECHFLCREHPGHLVELIRGKGHFAHLLPCVSDSKTQSEGLTRATWLGATQEQDVRVCLPILEALQPDWLIADHYSLDRRWELGLKDGYGRLMVIDDLADRAHQCDLLLDQTYARSADDYLALVPSGCQILCGSQYALLRPEFAALRSYSLRRRAQPQFRQLLITMGGVDNDNATAEVLKALRVCPLPKDCLITVAMGATAPWLSDVITQAQDMPWTTRVQVGVSDMAQLMADSDLAIGAAGATSWERCCLGLPTIMVVLADNQRQVANNLEMSGAAMAIHEPQRIAEVLHSHVSALVESPELLSASAQAAARVVDGHGTATVSRLLGACT